MRRWGIVISAVYALLVLTLFVPVLSRLMGGSWHDAFQWNSADKESREFALFLGSRFVAPLLVGQALLLFVSVDTSWKRARPRRHIAVSVATVGLFMALMIFAMVSCVWAIHSEDSLFKSTLSPWYEERMWLSVALWLCGLWAVWGAVFYAYLRDTPERLVKLVRWLITASVLELLVAVPAHVIVRRRDDCCAPLVTGIGIATGIAIMLACFGPGVLALYKKRFDSYQKRRANVAVRG